MKLTDIKCWVFTCKSDLTDRLVLSDSSSCGKTFSLSTTEEWSFSAAARGLNLSGDLRHQPSSEGKS